MKRILFLAAMVGSMLQLGVGSSLGLEMDPTPDISSLPVTSVYNAGTGAFEALGDAVSYNFSTPILDGSSGFHLTASIDTSGHFSVGSLWIEGRIGSTGSGSLLIATLTGMSVSDTALYFLFDTPAGDLQSAFAGRTGLVKLMPESWLGLDSFKDSFSDSAGTADTGVLKVPEQAYTGSLLAFGLMGFGAARRFVAGRRSTH